MPETFWGCLFLPSEQQSKIALVLSMQRGFPVSQRQGKDHQKGVEMETSQSEVLPRAFETSFVKIIAS